MRKSVSTQINENKVQVKAKAPKLTSKYQKRLILTIHDRDKQIEGLIRRIQEAAGWGHGFPVVVDPDDKEYKRSFYIDGDGSDSILDISVEEFEGGDENE